MSATELPLNMAMIKADLITAKDGIDRARTLSTKASKYIKGMAGFHLQQAAEKMIKIQLYASGKKLDLHLVYKHSLDHLMGYATSLGVELIIPEYIMTNSTVITAWEAAGRYDVHKVVKINQLEKCYSEIEGWFDELKKNGYR
jgi:HEPN domain-containing protein